MIKTKKYEKLTDENIKKVINLLKEDKPITKKSACEILNISYNTARLTRIIVEYNNQQKYIDSRKAKNRGKHATKEEISHIVSKYLTGETITNIAKALYRSSGFIKNIIQLLGVPHRPSNAEERFKVAFIPDECVSEIFEPKEKVWSAKYHALAIIKEEVEGYEEKYQSKCYSIYVNKIVEQVENSYFPNIMEGGFNAFSLAYDIGSLKHLAQYGI